MNDSEDVPKKTSRRRFTKTAASALVAMPVIASFSSCDKKSVPPPSPPGTPTPTPTRPPTPESSNPPIIIDGGSLSIALDTELDESTNSPDTPGSPRRYKLTQKTRRYGAITRVRLMNEVGTLLHDDFLVGEADSLALRIWLQTVDHDDDDVNYVPDPIPPNSEPQFLLKNTGTNRTFEIWYVETIGTAKKLHKKKRPHKKYRREKLSSKYFRIGKVGVAVGGTTFETPESAADDGFRIVVFLIGLP